jgi:hypothetical protein
LSWTKRGIVVSEIGKWLAEISENRQR